MRISDLNENRISLKKVYDLVMYHGSSMESAASSLGIDQEVLEYFVENNQEDLRDMAIKMVIDEGTSLGYTYQVDDKNLIRFNAGRDGKSVKDDVILFIRPEFEVPVMFEVITMYSVARNIAWYESVDKVLRAMRAWKPMFSEVSLRKVYGGHTPDIISSRAEFAQLEKHNGRTP